jgi:hypothetical protein
MTHDTTTMTIEMTSMFAMGVPPYYT